MPSREDACCHHIIWMPTSYFITSMPFGPASIGCSQAEGGLFSCLKKRFPNLSNVYEALFKYVCHLVTFLKKNTSAYENVTYLTLLAVLVRLILLIQELFRVLNI